MVQVPTGWASQVGPETKFKMGRAGCKQNYTQNAHMQQVIIGKVIYAINVTFA